jgi:hypothetical protein
MVDIAVQNHGSLFLLQPLTEQASAWRRCYDQVDGAAPGAVAAALARLSED